MRTYRFLTAAVLSVILSVQTLRSATYTKCYWLNNASCAVTFTFDDGLANQFSTIVPALENYGMRGTFYIVTDWATRDGIWPTLKKMAENGHEIGSHTLTHPTLATSSELVQSRLIIENKVGQPCTTIAYPYCNFPIDEDALKKHYISGRICSGTIMPYKFSDMYNISSIITGTSGTVKTADDFKTQFQNAQKSNGWCVFLTHEIDNGSGYSPTKSVEFKTALIYLKNRRTTYWVGTFKEVSQYVKENSCTKVTEVSENSDSIVVSLTNDLDPELYDCPLTIRRSVPDGWAQVCATQGSDTLSAWIDKGYLFFNAVPNAGDVTIRVTETSRVREIIDDTAGQAIAVSLSKDFVTVLSEMPVRSLELVDMSGRKVFSAENESIIPITGIPQGNYVLNVRLDESLQYTRKLCFAAK